MLFLPVLFLFIISAFLIYSPILSSFFLSDDFGFVAHLSEQCPINLVECLRRFGGALFFRPLTSFSFYFDFLLGNLSPIGYHATNVLIHGINSCLVLILAKLLVREPTPILEENSVENYLGNHKVELNLWRNRLPTVAGILFLVLPSHSEAVTWISARSDLLATCFILLSLVIYITNRNQSKSNQVKRNQFFSFILCPIFFGLALGSKESAIAYPILLISYEIYSWQKGDSISVRQIFANLTIYSSVILGYFWLRYLAIGVFVGGYGDGFKVPLLQVGQNFLAYIARTFFPPLGIVPLILLSIFCLVILIWRWRSQIIPLSTYTLLAFLFSGFLLFLLPVLNLAISLENTQEERFLYLPSVFAVIFLSICLPIILPKDSKRFNLGILSLSLCLVISLFNSNQTWLSASQIAESTIKSLDSLAQTEKLYVLNLPDRYRGAYIFRNSFARALQLFVPGKFAGVQTISFHNLESIDQKLLGTDNQLKSLDAPVEFYFKAKAEIFTPELGNLKSKEFSISNLSDRGFNFFLPNLKPEDRLVYYSDQKLIEIKSSPKS